MLSVRTWPTPPLLKKNPECVFGSVRVGHEGFLKVTVIGQEEEEKVFQEDS